MNLLKLPINLYMKQSLFKQKIKQAKAEKLGLSGENQNQSFPQPLKIQLATEDTVRKPAAQPEQTPVSLLQEMASLVPDKELNQIKDENQKIINQLTQEEILRYRQTIMKQMPMSFTQKFMRQQTQDKNSQNPSDKNVEENQAFESQAKTQPTTNKAIAQAQQLSQLRKQFLESLFVNVVTGQLLLTSQQSIQSNEPSSLCIYEVKTMIESENNQTQIIGAQIIEKLACFLQKTISSSSNQKIIKTNGGIVDRATIMDSVFASLIPSLLFRISCTKFKSVWVELVVSLCSIAKHVGKYLERDIQELVETKLGQYLNSQRFQNVQFAKEHIATCISAMKVQRSTGPSQKFDLKRELANIDDVIELVVLEESQYQAGLLSQHSMYLNGLIIFFEATKSTQSLFQLKSTFLFQLICKLKLTLNSPTLLKLKNSIYKFIWENTAYLFEGHLKIGNELLFELTDFTLSSLFVIKQLYPKLFEEYVSAFNDINVSKTGQERMLGFLMLLSLEKYIEQPLKGESEVNNLKMLLQSVQNMGDKEEICLPASLVLFELLFIYENNDSIYNEPELQSLDAILTQYIKKVTKPTLKLIVPIERLKVLIQKYNFSSFGSNSFTKLMFILAMTDSESQQLIIEEVMSRYPYLFYYATEDHGVYLPFLTEDQWPSSFYATDGLQAEKKEIKQMLGKDPACNRKNIYYRYLTESK